MADRCTLWLEKCCGNDWSDCCHRHDLDYVRQKISRKEADKKLLDCVKDKCKVVAYIMYAGVRSAGWWFWNKSKASNTSGSDKVN